MNEVLAVWLRHTPLDASHTSFGGFTADESGRAAQGSPLPEPDFGVLRLAHINGSGAARDSVPVGFRW